MILPINTHTHQTSSQSLPINHTPNILPIPRALHTHATLIHPLLPHNCLARRTHHPDYHPLKRCAKHTAQTIPQRRLVGVVAADLLGGPVVEPVGRGGEFERDAAGAGVRVEGLEEEAAWVY
jgi:hypothetical protein